MLPSLAVVAMSGSLSGVRGSSAGAGDEEQPLPAAAADSVGADPSPGGRGSDELALSN